MNKEDLVLSINSKYIGKFKENQIINNITIIDPTVYTKDNAPYVFIKCNTCGNKYYKVISDLKEVINCKLCFKKEVGKNHGSWKGYEEISLTHFNRIRLDALDRELKFNLTIKYMWNLYILQNKRCALSGEILSMPLAKNIKSGNASLDRIDSSKGYIKGNVQWVCKKINIAKQQLSDAEFIQLCKDVYENN